MAISAIGFGLVGCGADEDVAGGTTTSPLSVSETAARSGWVVVRGDVYVSGDKAKVEICQELAATPPRTCTGEVVVVELLSTEHIRAIAPIGSQDGLSQWGTDVLVAGVLSNGRIDGSAELPCSARAGVSMNGLPTFDSAEAALQAALELDLDFELPSGPYVRLGTDFFTGAPAEPSAAVHLITDDGRWGADDIRLCK